MREKTFCAFLAGAGFHVARVIRYGKVMSMRRLVMLYMVAIRVVKRGRRTLVRSSRVNFELRRGLFCADDRSTYHGLTVIARHEQSSVQQSRFIQEDHSYDVPSAIRHLHAR